MARTLFDIIRDCAKYNTIDSAIFPIQEILGVESGDVAGMFFSILDKPEDWAAMDLQARRRMIVEYIHEELTLEFTV